MPSPRTKTTNFTYIAFIASALVLLMLAFFSFRLFNQQRSAADLVTHTYRVKLKIEQLVANLRNAESSQRGFLLTQDSSFLGPFNTVEPVMNTSIAQLRDLISDNASQVQNLNQIATLIGNRITIMKEAVIAFQNDDQVTTARLLSEGKTTMDLIRNQTDAFEKAEDKILAERLEKKKEADTWSSGSILFFTVVSFAVLIFSFIRLRRESVVRTRAETLSEQLEQKVEERTREIVDMNRQLQEQNLLLEKQNEELNSFTFVASHDLKEPLRKIETFAVRIGQTETEHLSQRGKDYFNSIIKASNRMQTLIDDILSYSRTNIAQQYRNTDLNEVLKKSIETMNERILEKGAVIDAAELPTVNAIPEQMEQLFTNIISNALKYAKQDVLPELNIAAKKEKDKAGKMWWRIDFSDNGIGFDEIYKDKIFQIFQRLHSKTEYTGTGIGLAICKKVAENHGGSISATSVVGKGSVFTIILPADKD